MTFEKLDIDPQCLNLLREQEIVQPTPVQAQTIPLALDGRDVMAIAQTGTGKTLAFGLPALTRLAETKARRNSMLVLTPTRELAQQVHGVIKVFGKVLKLRSTCLYGGVGLQHQTKTLRRGCAIIVATPGRLLDHLGRGNLHFNNLSILVLDEADRMLDMGFLPDIRRILRMLPEDRQTMMFSATFPPDLSRLATDMLQNPARVEVTPSATPVKTVQQYIYTVHQTGKMALLSKVLRGPEIQSALVFIRTKHRTERVARELRKAGFRTQAIHGDRSQVQRERALDGFRQGRYNILVATDVAARGLDIQGISHVINFDIPPSFDDYIHRIGRTARADAKGDAITFVCPDELMALATIESALGKNLPRQDWEGSVTVLSLFNPDRRAKSTGNRHRARRRPSLLRRR